MSETEINFVVVMFFMLWLAFIVRDIDSHVKRIERDMWYLRNGMKLPEDDE